MHVLNLNLRETTEKVVLRKKSWVDFSG